MGNQAERFEDDVEVAQLDELDDTAGVGPEALPEPTVTPLSETKFENSGQTNDHTSGIKPISGADQNGKGDPNLLAPQYELEDGDVEGERKEAEDETPKKEHDQTRIALGEAKKPKKKKKSSKSKSKRGKVFPNSTITCLNLA